MYYLCHPETKEIKYIGMTKSPKTRLSGHISDFRTNNIWSIKHDWVYNLSIINLKPEMVVFHSFSSKSECESHERLIVKLLLEKGYSLLNDIGCMKSKPGVHDISLTYTNLIICKRNYSSLYKHAGIIYLNNSLCSDESYRVANFNISVSLDSGMFNKLKTLSEIEDRSVNNMVKTILLDYFKHLDSIEGLIKDEKK